VVVVESLEHALARGARIWLEITGTSRRWITTRTCFCGLENAMRLR